METCLANLSYDPGECIGNRFEVHRGMLGGFSQVYLCFDLEDDGRPYALKAPRVEFLQDFRVMQNFNREAETWISLGQHPNIVTCYLLTKLDNLPFIVLDWIQSNSGNSSLRHKLIRGEHSTNLALSVVIGACRGLIHGNIQRPGIVHGDIKPENILLTSQGIPKLTDFGAARLPADAFTDTEKQREFIMFGSGSKGVFGTRAYAAPELFTESTSVDCRADIYSLGCILVETITGLRYERNNREVFRLIDPEVREIAKRCVALDPANRYRTIEDLCLDLEQTAEGLFGLCLEDITPIGDALEADNSTNQGITFFEVGQYGAALEAFSKAIMLNPSAESYLHRSFALHKLSRFTDALLDAKQSLNINPKLSQAWVAKGLAYEGLSLPQEALSAYSRAIELAPNNSAAYSNRGTLYLKLGDSESALKDMNQAVTREPNRDNYFNRGMVHAFRHEYDKAIQDFGEAREIDPVWYLPYYMKGKILGLMGDYQSAVDALSLAIELNPQEADAYYLLGLAFLNLAVVGMAESSLQEAKKLGHLEASRLLEQIEKAQLKHQVPQNVALDILPLVNRLMEASGLDDVRAIITENPNFDWENFVAAIDFLSTKKMFNKKKRKELNFRLQWLREALNIEQESCHLSVPELKEETVLPEGTEDRVTTEPLQHHVNERMLPNPVIVKSQEKNEHPRDDTSSENLYLAGMRKLNSGRYQDALVAFEQAIRINDSPDAWLGKGMTLKELGRPQEALAAYDQALRCNPDYPRAWWHRGITLNDLGKHQEALEAYDQALKGKFDSTSEVLRSTIQHERDELFIQFWFNKGTELYYAGHYREALAAYDQAKMAEPDNPRILLGKSLSLLQLGKRAEAVDCLCQAWCVRNNTTDESLVTTIADVLRAYGVAPQDCETRVWQ
ncbi:MAG: serine/threonine-protein kinase [Xenococcaceae cyanobacterium MO_188.B29]|nr:serine/threonine-protein kinase [Xenococcaceae cyanobacterium MO_188.B29]